MLTKRWFPYICKKETNFAVLEMKKVCLFCYKPTLMFISVDSFIKLCCKQKLEIQGSSVLIARPALAYLSMAVPFWIIQTSAYVRAINDEATSNKYQTCNRLSHDSCYSTDFMIKISIWFFSQSLLLRNIKNSGKIAANWLFVP